MSQSSLNQCNKFTQKIVLKIPFVGDNGKESALHIHCLGLLEDGAL